MDNVEAAAKSCKMVDAGHDCNYHEAEEGFCPASIAIRWWPPALNGAVHS